MGGVTGKSMHDRDTDWATLYGGEVKYLSSREKHVRNLSVIGRQRSHCCQIFSFAAKYCLICGSLSLFLFLCPHRPNSMIRNNRQRHEMQVLDYFVLFQLHARQQFFKIAWTAEKKPFVTKSIVDSHWKHFRFKAQIHERQQIEIELRLHSQNKKKSDIQNQTHGLIFVAHAHILRIVGNPNIK